MPGKYSVVLVVIALLAGLAIGFAGSTLSYRYGLLRVPGERPFQRMARVLELTPTQRDQIRRIMHETHAEAAATRRRFHQQRHQLFINAYLRIRAVLTPHQQKLFDARFVPPSVRAAAQHQQGTAQASPPPTASPSPG